MRCCLTISFCMFISAPACGQWSLSQLFVPVVEDFSSFTAPSLWGTASPAANQLDSDIWAFSATSHTGSVSSSFGNNFINGEGINTGGVTTQGLYAFDNGAGLKGIGPQADDTRWSPGNLTIKLRNDTGSTIEELRVEWDYLLYNDQTGRRSSQLLISSTDNAGSYAAPFGGSVLTQDAPQGTLSWLNIARDVTLNANIADGDDYYLRWSFNDLAGSAGTGVDRDEIGIADLRITPLVDVAGDFDTNGVVDGLDFLAWQVDPSVGFLSDWENNYGNSVSIAAVPEPNSLLMVAMAAILAISYRRN